MGGGICCGGLIYARMSLFDIEKTVIKMYQCDNIAWFIIFLILYVSFISQDHDGDDYLVFLSKA